MDRGGQQSLIAGLRQAARAASPGDADAVTLLSVAMLLGWGDLLMLDDPLLRSTSFLSGIGVASGVITCGKGMARSGCSISSGGTTSSVASTCSDSNMSPSGTKSMRHRFKRRDFFYRHRHQKKSEADVSERHRHRGGRA